jgi:hypothetical protein
MENVLLQHWMKNSNEKYEIRTMIACKTKWVFNASNKTHLCDVVVFTFVVVAAVEQ